MKQNELPDNSEVKMGSHTYKYLGMVGEHGKWMENSKVSLFSVDGEFEEIEGGAYELVSAESITEFNALGE